MPAKSEKQRKMMAIPSQTDLAYMAGILDGEGYITMKKEGRWPVFTVPQNEIETREDFKDRLSYLNKRGILCLQ